jgi:hypothetical protein
VKGWIPEPHPKDDRLRLEALVNSPEDRCLEFSERNHEVVAAVNHERWLWGRYQELSDQGEHRAAAETLERYKSARLAASAAAAPMIAKLYASLPDHVAEWYKNNSMQIEQLVAEAIALRAQGKLQVAEETYEQAKQLAHQARARDRAEIKRRGNPAALLNYDFAVRDNEANLPMGTTARLERSYGATPH